MFDVEKRKEITDYLAYFVVNEGELITENQNFKTYRFSFPFPLFSLEVKTSPEDYVYSSFTVVEKYCLCC